MIEGESMDKKNNNTLIIIIVGVIGIFLLLSVLLVGLSMSFNPTEEAETKYFSFQTPSNYELKAYNNTPSNDRSMNHVEEFIFSSNDGHTLIILEKSFNIYDPAIQNALQNNTDDLSKTFQNMISILYTDTQLKINSSDGQTPLKINNIDGYYKLVDGNHVFSFGSNSRTVFFITNDPNYEDLFSQIIVTKK